jgi:integrase
MPNGKQRVRVTLKGVHKVRRRHADGKEAVHYYFRATRQKLEGEPGTPEFLQSYAAAERAMRERSRGTLADLIRRFEQDKYGNMSETTRLEYVRKLKIIDRDWGSCPICALTEREFKKDIIKWRNEKAKTAPREADNLASALSAVLALAVKCDELEKNVLDGLDRVYQSDRSEMIWLPEHVAAFTKVATLDMWHALMLALHTGQRQADLLKLPWSAWNGERITLRQSKAKGKKRERQLVSVKATTALKAMLDGMERRSPLILVTPTGRAWKKRYFSQRWQETCEAAGITELHFHDLRGTAATMLAETDCTVPQIASIMGWTVAYAQQIIDTYLARTRQLADAAIVKFEQHPRLQSSS